VKSSGHDADQSDDRSEVSEVQFMQASCEGGS
jgi:hypothetical protein